jgi:hypothetical protein
MTKPDYPAYISFTDASALIVRLGVVGSMTPRGLRYLAKARSTNEDLPAEQRWPFGDGPDQEAYLPAGRTRMMRTELLLEYLEKHPPTGRGPDSKPRQRSVES